MHTRDRQDDGAERLAAGLGYFSIALGVAETLAPLSMARLIGLPENHSTISRLRAFGAREIATGVAILAQPDRSAWLWGRVGGDVMDISYLASASGQLGSSPTRLATAIAAVLGVTVLDAYSARQLARPPREHNGASAELHVEHAVTINKPREEVYQFWRDFTRFPQFMRHVEAVTLLEDGRSRWRAKGPAGTTVEWDAKILRDEPSQLIEWQSEPGFTIENRGSVHFTTAPGNKGTEVRVQIHYRPLGGALGHGLAWLFGEAPEQQVREDLARFKQLIETGEIPLSDGPGLLRPAQPPRDAEELRTLMGVRI